MSESFWFPSNNVLKLNRFNVCVCVLIAIIACSMTRTYLLTRKGSINA